VKLLLDEHLSSRVAAELRRRGHDVISVVERPEGRASPDETLWAATRADGRAIATQDIGDFVRLAAQDAAIGKRNAGLVLIHPQRFSPGERGMGRLIASLDALLDANPADDALEGRTVWLEPPGDERSAAG
jgi:hypothetical protein